MEETASAGVGLQGTVQGREWVEPADSGRGQGEWREACLKRKAWAQSRDSLWTDPPEAPRTHAPSEDPPEAPRTHAPSDDPLTHAPSDDPRTHAPSEDPGRVPNKIASWLNECRTPLGASLDDQNICPPKGLVRNACSFEDDLSLGAEANHLQSSRAKAEPTCYVVAAQEKRSQFKLRGQSMNSTGSGKSSQVSSVSELLDLYEEDPEEILYNLGFGREEPDLASKVPSRFFNSSSEARGIDIKVYLGAQLQRMELENPNYALTSRFRQIEVLTTVANEFFQLYSQVSGNPVQRIGSRDQGREEGGEERVGGGEMGGPGEAPVPPMKRNSSALNVARILKKTITKHNLLSQPVPDTPTAPSHAHPGHSNNMALVNGHAMHSTTDSSSTDAHHRGGPLRKDSCSLATVTEESNGSSREETEDLTDNRPEDRPIEEEEPQSASQTEERPPSPNQTEDQPQLANQTEDQQLSANQTEDQQLSANQTERAPPLLHPHLTQLRTETKDSFEMEEVLSNEDETRTSSRTSGLIRTVSQQSDSSGFAEEPSTDSNSYLKVQDSSDSCDSETTVTSHASHDLATPLATDQPVFQQLADTQESLEESQVHAGTCGSSEEVHAGTCSPSEEVHAGTCSSSEEVHAGTCGSVEVPGQTGHTGTPSETQHTQLQSAQSTAAPEGSEVEAEGSGSSALLVQQAESSGSGSSALLVQQALERAKRYHNSLTLTLPGRGRGTPTLRRSMSLPSSSPVCPSSPASRMVSSLRVQVGGRGSTPPQHSGEEPTNHLSTLLINPASSHAAAQSSSEGETPTTRVGVGVGVLPHKSHLTRRKHLTRSSYSLRSSSPPPPDWLEQRRPLGGPAHGWSTQSVPDLCSQSQRLHQQHHHPTASPPDHRYVWSSNSGLPMCDPFHSAWDPQTSTPQHPHPSASNSTQQHPPSQYYAQPPYYTSPPHQSLPNHLYYPPRPPLPQQPTTPIMPHHSSLSNLEQPTTPTMPHHHQSSPYLPPTSPYAGYHGYGFYPYPSFHLPPPHSHYPHPGPTPGQGLYPGQGSTLAPGQGLYPGQGTTLAPGQGLYPGQGSTLAPGQGLYPGQGSTLAPGQGLYPGQGSTLAPGQGLYPGQGSTLAPGQGLYPGQGSTLAPGLASSTEMQLRRVLHDIRGAVQTLNQRPDTPSDLFADPRSGTPTQQSLVELQQKRESLCEFRRHMMDLELSIIRQQALVYTHLSPADRLQADQLQALRSAVRRELQELEFQLEDRLHTHPLGGSVDDLSTSSALRAMEPVSELLREQLFLQSELDDGSHTPSTATGPSSRSSSPMTAGGEPKQEVYRASINITPAPPPRPNVPSQEREEEEERGGEERREGGGEEEERGGEERRGGEGRREGGVRAEDLQQLIQEIRQSVADEIRQEILQDLLSVMSPQRSPLATREPL